MTPRISAFFPTILVAISMVTCVTARGPGGDGESRKAPLPGYGLHPADDPSTPRVAEGRHGAIATAHPLASKAGLDMLRSGGNAVDAAVAASLVISVVRPQSTGLAGGGFLLYHEQAESKGGVRVYDFRERAPAKATRDMYLDAKGEPKPFLYEGAVIPNASVNGHLAVGTPGLVAGLLKVHGEHGRLPFAKVIEPAIRLAEKGFPVYGDLAVAIERRREIMEHFPATRKVFLPDGKPLQKGELLVQKDLAWTLKQIRGGGAKAFYEGPVAEKLLAEMKRGGGLISADDLKDYEVKERKPVSGTYRGYRIVSMPPPSSGGVHIVQILNMLEGDDYGSYGAGTSKSLHLLAEAMRRAFADRARYLGDPDFVDIPLEGLLSKKYARNLRSTIQDRRASRSTEVGAGDPAAYESDSTTHISVVDRWGNAVSTTHTVNYTFGSCVIAEGTGMFLNDEMDDFSKKPGEPNAYGLVGSAANAIAARKTMLSSMSPTLVFDPKGRIELVLGSPGGPRIITSVLQTIINYLDFKMPLEKAVHAPRIHHQWLPDAIRIEPDTLETAVIEKLSAMGHKILSEGRMGDVQAVGRSKKGWIGVSDIRSTGSPMAY